MMKSLACMLLVLSSCWSLNVIPKEKGVIQAFNDIYNSAISLGRVPLFNELRELVNGRPNLGKLFTYATAFENYDLDELTAFVDRNIPGVGFNRLNAVVSVLPSIQKSIKFMHRNEKDPMVKIEDGWLRGIRIRPAKYRHFDAFMGVPFASKPERFRPLKPVKPWTGVLTAQKEQQVCVQYLPEINDLIGSEDCLYANIITPSIKMKNLPVLVWIHGGLFKLGFGNMYYYGPDFLLQEDILVVMFNYRLGVFGFMSTQDHHMSANLGMKDIVFFLRWLKKNIRSFGGDPDNVTLFGISTGAAAIQLLTVSPMADGLYHKLIANSASLKHYWAYTNDPTANVYRLAKNLDIDITDRAKMVRDLKKADARLMVRAAERIFRDQYPDEEFLAFVPCAEVEIPGEERFLTEYPNVVLDSGNYTKVPMMLGFMSAEGLFWMTGDRSLSRYNDNLEYSIPKDLMLGLKTHAQKTQLLQHIRDFYFKGGKVNKANELQLVDFLSDAKILYMMHSYTKKLVQDTDLPIFYYEFAYDGYLGQTRSFGNITLRGVAHADDCGYIFRLVFGDPLEGDHEAEFVIRRQVHLMANFAKYGHPTPFHSKMTPIRWDPVSSPDNLEYLRITKDIEMRVKPNEERMKFWDYLYSVFGT